MNNDVIYERDLALAKRDFIKEGGSDLQWKEMLKLSDFTVRGCGFANGYSVRRVANKWRIKK